MADKKPDLKEIHEKAIKRADEAYVSERDNVTEGREDQKFYAGEQWDAAAQKARGTERPMLTVNRMGTFVRQVTGDLRQNTPAVKVLPSGGKASQDKADILSGMIRSIEAKSDAAACYVKGASNAAIAGQGAFRVLTRYCNDRNFDQELYIEPIADPFGVLIDPFARLPDKSDMGYAFVLEEMSKEGFKAKYPEAQADDFPMQGDGGMGFEWATGEKVRIAEYWCRETKTQKLYELADGSIVDELPTGQKATREREVEVVSIVSYMMSGKEVLSGPHAWAGKYIPVCFIPGEEITINGATKRKGMVRDAKDPQRLLNYARTTDAETTALQPKAPFVATVDQVKGFEDIWNTAGTKNHSVLYYNYVPAMGPNQTPKREPPPVMSTGLQNLSLQAGQDLHDVIGIYPASLGAKSNETSGVAIRARQHEGDTGSNYIPDNTKRAIAYCGRILCDLIPKIYDTPRIVRLLKESGEHEMAKINAEGPEPDDSEDISKIVGSLQDGEYDVVVSTGPSYLTRQQEMADTIVELGRTMPQIGQVAADLLVKALNIPGGDEIAKRLERMIPPNVKEDNVAPPPPTAEDVEAAAKAQKAKAEAEGVTIDNLQKLFGMLQVIEGIPQQMQAMSEQLAKLSGAQMGQQPEMPAGPMPPPDGNEPSGGAPPAPSPADLTLEPMAEAGEPELEPMPQGATV